MRRWVVCFLAMSLGMSCRTAQTAETRGARGTSHLERRDVTELTEVIAELHQVAFHGKKMLGLAPVVARQRLQKSGVGLSTDVARESLLRRRRVLERRMATLEAKLAEAGFEENNLLEMERMRDLLTRLRHSLAQASAEDLAELGTVTEALLEIAGIVEMHDGMALSRFWAQRYVGADLARSTIEKAQIGRDVRVGSCEYINPKAVPDGRITDKLKAKLQSPRSDDYFTHGTNTWALMAGEAPGGVSPRAILAGAAWSIGPDSAPTVLGFESVYKFLLEEPLDVMNCSCDLDEAFNDSNVGGHATNFMMPMVDAGGIFVQSAGNDFPRGENGVHAASNQMLQVSNYSPLGVLAFSSSRSRFSSIGAPAGMGEQTSIILGRYHRFGGTSGAAPIVAGVAANLRSLLPQASLGDIETILRRTIFKTPASPATPALTGMVNAYRAVRVGMRLSRTWPESRGRLQEDELYDFEEEARSIFLGHRGNLMSQNRSTREQALEKIREAFLLLPDDPDISSVLAEALEREGAKVDAVFVRYRGHLPRGVAQELLGNPMVASMQGDLLRAMAENHWIDAEVQERCNASMINTSLPAEAKYQTVYALRYLDIVVAYEVGKALIRGSDKAAKLRLIGSAYDLFLEEGSDANPRFLGLMHLALRDADKDVREAAQNELDE